MSETPEQSTDGSFWDWRVVSNHNQVVLSEDWFDPELETSKSEE